MRTIIYADGGSRGNPGPSAIGVIFTNEKGKVVKEYAQKIGRATNNEAEYEAVIFALQKAKLLFGKKKAKTMELEVRVDSEFVAKQLTVNCRQTTSLLSEQVLIDECRGQINHKSRHSPPRKKR